MRGSFLFLLFGWVSATTSSDSSMILRCWTGVLSAIGTASNAIASSLLYSFAFRLSSVSSSSSFSSSAAWRRYFTVRASTVSATVSTSNGVQRRGPAAAT